MKCLLAELFRIAAMTAGACCFLLLFAWLSMTGWNLMYPVQPPTVEVIYSRPPDYDIDCPAVVFIGEYSTRRAELCDGNTCE